MTFHFYIDESAALMRLDQALSLHVKEMSRSAVTRHIKENGVFVNGALVKKPGSTVAEGDLVEGEIAPPVPVEISAKDIPLDILYEDADVLVINKPKGMVVHPAAGHYDDTLVNAILYHCGDSLSGIGGVMRPGIVHRIDKDTTGALLVCKNDKAHRALSAQLKAHTIGRTYVAIVYGLVRDDGGTIEGYIGRSTKDRKRMAVVESEKRGKHAVTHYRVLARYQKMRLTYIACRLETGRTHQIRVHMSSAGHPLLGDAVYAPKRKSPFADLEGQCLHAKTLSFIHPESGEEIRIEAPLPPYFTALLDKME